MLFEAGADDHIWQALSRPRSSWLDEGSAAAQRDTGGTRCLCSATSSSSETPRGGRRRRLVAELSPKEFDLLAYLIQNRGVVVARHAARTLGVWITRAGRGRSTSTSPSPGRSRAGRADQTIRGAATRPWRESVKSPKAREFAATRFILTAVGVSLVPRSFVRRSARHDALARSRGRRP